MTLSQTWIVAFRPDGKRQTVESGWQVWHGWGTKLAVPFIYFTTNDYDLSEGSAKGGCYNVDTKCNQFIMWTNQVILGRPLPPSVSGGLQSDLHIEWFLKPNGNWWLRMNGIWIGYYPKEVFGAGPLPAGGQVIDFGGENTGLRAMSEMGSGRFAQEGFGVAAYQSDMGYYDMKGDFINLKPNSDPLTPSASAPLCYTLEFNVQKPLPNTSALYFFFGGPGTNHFRTDPSVPIPPPERCHGWVQSSGASANAP